MDAAVGSLDDQQVQQQAFAVFINLRVLVVKPWGRQEVVPLKMTVSC